jgi:preprotein translocase subunit SecF
MLIGIVAGTYSTVFIASAIATLLSERGQRRSRQIASFRRTSSTISGN